MCVCVCVCAWTAVSAVAHTHKALLFQLIYDVCVLL